VYTAALENGMLPCEYTPNERLTYAQYANYSPRNSDGKYEGVYSMRGALTKSINTIAVETALRAGLDNVVAQANRMGIEGNLRAIPSLALGSEEASLWEMARVYSTFANRGVTPAKLHYLDRIETADGKVIVQFERPSREEGRRTISQNTADIMTYLLQGVVNNGTASRIRRNYGLNGPLAGKTGTTQSQSDGWFLGYTPNLVVGTWVGAEYPAVHFRTLSRGQAASTALPIWGRFMRYLYRDNDYRDYRRGGFPQLADTTHAYLQCPDYLEEMPIYMDSLEEAYYRMLIESYEQFREMTPLELRELLENQPVPRNEESPAQYQERVERYEERQDRRDERRQKRKEFWSKLLFKKDDDG
jgi:penicillin-binding protein 1A